MKKTNVIGAVDIGGIQTFVLKLCNILQFSGVQTEERLHGGRTIPIGGECQHGRKHTPHVCGTRLVTDVINFLPRIIDIAQHIVDFGINLGEVTRLPNIL